MDMPFVEKLGQPSGEELGQGRHFGERSLPLGWRVHEQREAIAEQGRLLLVDRGIEVLRLLARRIQAHAVHSLSRGPRSTHDPVALQELDGARDRASTRQQGIAQVVDRLRGRLADEEIAQQAACHRGEAVLPGIEAADSVGERQMVGPMIHRAILARLSHMTLFPVMPAAREAARGRGVGSGQRFERGGWVTDTFDDEAMAALDEIYGRADAFLFGRRTYEGFARSWGVMEELRAHPIGVALNARPKYVVSTTPFEPEWANTTVLSGDVAAAIRELKARPGGELQVPGSGVLVRWLLANDLVDEITLFTVPVVVGQGTRLFPDNGPQQALELVEARATPAGVTIQVYRPTRGPQDRTPAARAIVSGSRH